MAVLRRAAVLALSLGLLAGCANSRPYEYHDNREQPLGPGLLSGDSGVFGVPPKAAAGCDQKVTASCPE